MYILEKSVWVSNLSYQNLLPKPVNRLHKIRCVPSLNCLFWCLLLICWMDWALFYILFLFNHWMDSWTHQILGYIDLYITGGFATTHVVVSVRHPITYYSPHPLPTLQIRWRFILERIKLTARVASIHAHYTRYFPANGSTNPDVF